MPVTLAHPVAVLPLRWLGVPLTPFVVGSMVPDVPLFARSPDGYAFTHSVLGLLTWAPAVGLLVVALWYGVVRDALVGLSPPYVRARLDPHVRLSVRAWCLVPLGGAVGALTHVAWDELTHPGRWGAQHVPWLAAQHGPLLGVKWLQYSSGVLGVAVLVVAALVFLRGRPVRAEVPPPVVRVPLLALAVAVAAVVGLVTAVRRAPEGLHAVAFGSVVNGLVALVAAVLVVAVLWQVALLRSGRPGYFST